MFLSSDYQLLDFGDGRRLERFGAFTLDRPCAAAERVARSNRSAWQVADARFEGRNEEKGQWTCQTELPERWTIAHGASRFELKRTEFGHLGIFPEQAENWDWIAEQCDAARRGTEPTHSRPRVHLGEMDLAAHNEPPSPLAPDPSPVKQEMGDSAPFKVLNLFAYTGGSTLAAAAAGVEVTHVDAAKNVVAWARRNAELSGLAEAPIRWIAEDAVKFVARELKRGNRYDAVILDPPSYGHGPKGQVWRLSEDLPRLLAMCAELTDGQPAFMLLTCHTPGYEAAELRDLMQEALGAAAKCTARPLSIPSTAGRCLSCGTVAAVGFRRKTED